MELVSEEESDATRYLVKAWNDTFGRNPNASSAYGNAIKAVEAACWQIVVPADQRATLGSAIRELRDHPERFSVKVTEKTAHNAIEGIRRDMSTIWDSQTDRHGTANPVAPHKTLPNRLYLLRCL